MSNILSWNAVALEVGRRDHSQGYANGQHSGPTKTSRALAIVHLSIYNVVAAFVKPESIYQKLGSGASFGAAPNLAEAVDGAASEALRQLYPRQAQLINDSVSAHLQSDSYIGGVAVATAVLASRKDDGSGAPDPSATGMKLPYGQHRPDPFDPRQPLLGKDWGGVRRFTGQNHQDLARFPGSDKGGTSFLDDAHYKRDYEEVKLLGSHASAERSARETMIGLFWAYDGASGVGVPPRLYNQILRTVIADRALAKLPALSELELATLFAKVNVAMADAGIDAWHHKYHPENNLWRPVAGIRHESEGHADGSTPDPFWAPLGAPQTNRPGAFSRTPPFPAYPSGHATFGAALFQVLRLHFKGAPITTAGVVAATEAADTDVPFTFISDELNGISMDPNGSVRTELERTFKSYEYAIWENAVSRVYLGVHWRFDGLPGKDAPDADIGGVPLGLKVGIEAHEHFERLLATVPPAAPAPAPVSTASAPAPSATSNGNS